MTVQFTLSEKEIADALTKYVLEKHPQYKGASFKPTRKVKSYSFKIEPKNEKAGEKKTA